MPWEFIARETGEFGCSICKRQFNKNEVFYCVDDYPETLEEEQLSGSLRCEACYIKFEKKFVQAFEEHLPELLDQIEADFSTKH